MYKHYLQASKPKLFSRDRTVRHPPLRHKMGMISDSVRMNQVLNELRMDSNRLMITMLNDAVYGTYDDFATGAKNPRANPTPKVQNPTEVTKEVRDWPSGSLESLHGLYHGMLGGFAKGVDDAGGHMSRVGVAAFDPVFVSKRSSPRDHR